mmetsp:Transcript_36928/g.68672  ORF Transcript_36928/g.68672 Transcript_36928/m.68672 type:complete len:214 (+) Transcript_36928:374-1015(+)
MLFFTITQSLETNIGKSRSLMRYFKQRSKCNSSNSSTCLLLSAVHVDVDFTVRTVSSSRELLSTTADTSLFSSTTRDKSARFTFESSICIIVVDSHDPSSILLFPPSLLSFFPSSSLRTSSLLSSSSSLESPSPSLVTTVNKENPLLGMDAGTPCHSKSPNICSTCTAIPRGRVRQLLNSATVSTSDIPTLKGYALLRTRMLTLSFLAILSSL